MYFNEPEKVNKVPQKTQRMKTIIKREKEAIALGKCRDLLSGRRIKKSCQSASMQRKSKSKRYLDISLSLRDTVKGRHGVLVEFDFTSSRYF